MARVVLLTRGFFPLFLCERDENEIFQIMTYNGKNSNDEQWCLHSLLYLSSLKNVLNLPFNVDKKAENCYCTTNSPTYTLIELDLIPAEQVNVSVELHRLVKS